LIFKIDNIVKSRFKDWIPACAGMTSVISIRYSLTFCHSREGGNPENGKIRLFTKPSKLSNQIENQTTYIVNRKGRQVIYEFPQLFESPIFYQRIIIDNFSRNT